jgi:hypothetical protein
VPIGWPDSQRVEDYLAREIPLREAGFGAVDWRFRWMELTVFVARRAPSATI